jgi:hypothetical protein
VSKPALGPIKPAIQWAPGPHSMEIKRPEREADNSLPYSAQVTNAWSYTFILLYVFMARCLIKYKTLLYLTHREKWVFGVMKPICPLPVTSEQIHRHSRNSVWTSYHYKGLYMCPFRFIYNTKTTTNCGLRAPLALPQGNKCRITKLHVIRDLNCNFW